MGSEVVTTATTPVPSPLAVTGIVDIDIPNRTLAVRLSELESGYSKLWWRESHAALKAAELNGWRSHRTVYASTPTASDVAHAVPGDYQMLLFRFPSGEASFVQLVGRAGLIAIVVLDRSAGRFVSVKFLHRP
jgi:hypothetical protein